jgi:class 3 adenylate cyclase/tetratricopeptide (TPR) repeat protein
MHIDLQGIWPADVPITILIGDIENSTKLYAACGDAEALAIIEACREVVQRGVAAHGGRVVRSPGEGIMAAFAAPRRAVVCALAIERQVAEDAARNPDLALALRVGVHTGELPGRRRGDLHGVVVNAATQICLRARGGQVLISDVVRQLCGTITDVEIHDHGVHELKGFSEPSRLFRVESVREPRGACQLTPFVGRDSSRTQLRLQLDYTWRGRGAVVMIGGEAGVGKTRLSQEIAAEARQRGFGVLAGHCYETHADLPYMPWVEMLEEMVRQLDSHAARELLGSYAAALAQMVPELRRMLSDIPPMAELPPDQQRRYLFTSVRGFLARASDSRPLLLRFEDLHCADESTLTLLDHLMEWVEEMPVLVIGTFRNVAADVPDRLAATLARVPRRRTGQILSLGRLSFVDVEAMLRGLSGRQPPREVVAALYSESDGNPFFLEELFRHLAGMGRLFDEDGHFRHDLRVDDLDVPINVKLVTGERLRRLSPRTREMLEVASVVGRHFSLGLLEHLVVLETEELIEALEEAERAQVIRDEPTLGPDTYWFSHELFRHTLISELPTLRRRRYHLQVADALERLYKNLSSHAGDIAHHLLASGSAADQERAAYYLLSAGDRAQQAAAYEEALRNYEHAASILPADDTPTYANVLLKIGMSRRGLGRWDDAVAAWNESLTLLEQLGEEEAVAATCWDLCQQLAWGYRFKEMVAVAHRARAAVGDRQSPQRARILGMMGTALALSGEPEEADEHAAEARHLAEESGEADVLADVGLTETFHHYFFMRLPEAAEVGQRAAAVLRTLNSPWNLTEVLALLDTAQVFQARFTDSVKLHGELESLAACLRHHGAACIAHRNAFAMAAAQRGNLDELERLAQAHMTTALKTNNAGWVAFSDTLQGILGLWRGDWDSARMRMGRGAKMAGPFWLAAQQGWVMVLDAWCGLTDAVHARLESLEFALPRPGHANLIGSWTLAALGAEAIGLVGGRWAGRLHDLMREAIATGAVMRQFDGRLLQTAAGMAAARAGRSEAAEEHFDIALRQVSDLPHRLERPHVLHGYARLLLERGGRANADRAHEHADAAVRDYSAIGMSRHVALARELLSAAGSMTSPSFREPRSPQTQIEQGANAMNGSNLVE